MKKEWQSVCESNQDMDKFTLLCHVSLKNKLQVVRPVILHVCTTLTCPVKILRMNNL